MSAGLKPRSPIGRLMHGELKLHVATHRHPLITHRWKQFLNESAQTFGYYLPLGHSLQPRWTRPGLPHVYQTDSGSGGEAAQSSLLPLQGEDSPSSRSGPLLSFPSAMSAVLSNSCRLPVSRTPQRPAPFIHAEERAGLTRHGDGHKWGLISVWADSNIISMYCFLWATFIWSAGTDLKRCTCSLPFLCAHRQLLCPSTLCGFKC